MIETTEQAENCLSQMGFQYLAVGTGAYVLHKALEVKRKEKFPPEKGKRTTIAEKQKPEGFFIFYMGFYMTYYHMGFYKYLSENGFVNEILYCAAKVDENPT